MTDNALGGDLGPLALVHGAWHGAWCWSKILDLIDPACRRVVPVQLPFESTRSDVAALREVVENLGPRTVVCGHSYGGRLTSVVADAVDVAHLIYVAAPTPNATQLAAYATADRLRSGEVPDFDTARRTFYNGCTEGQARAAWKLLRPMRDPPGTIVGLEHRPWERLPATYVTCLRDHALRPDVQREMAGNMLYHVDLDTDHSPFLSAPEEFARVLNNVLRHGRPGSSPVG